MKVGREKGKRMLSRRVGERAEKDRLVERAREILSGQDVLGYLDKCIDFANRRNIIGDERLQLGLNLNVVRLRSKNDSFGAGGEQWDDVKTEAMVKRQWADSTNEEIPRLHQIDKKRAHTMCRKNIRKKI